jgi:hypothetical protein
MVGGFSNMKPITKAEVTEALVLMDTPNQGSLKGDINFEAYDLLVAEEHGDIERFTIGYYVILGYEIARARAEKRWELLSSKFPGVAEAIEDLIEKEGETE